MNQRRVGTAVKAVSAVVALLAAVAGGIVTTAGVSAATTAIPTSVVLSASPNPAIVGQPVTVTASITPATGNLGNVVFVGVPASAGCTAVSVTTIGGATTATCTCTYTYSDTSGSPNPIGALYGDLSGTYGPSASAMVLPVVQSSSTDLTTSLNPSSTGAPVTLTATVTSSVAGIPAGTVSFLSDGVTILGCGAQALGDPTTATTATATCTTSFAAAGTPSITAVYSGSAVLATSTSLPVAQAVYATTSTGLASVVNPSLTGQPVTYVAQVNPAPTGGTVDFMDGGTTIAGCGAVDLTAGSAICPVAAGYPASGGSHAITAAYSGATGFTPSSSQTLAQNIDPGATTTSLTATVNPSVTGESVTFIATGTATAPATGTPTGTVDFTSDGSSIGCDAVPLAGGMATCTTSFDAVNGPSHLIEAVYAGGGDFNGSSAYFALAVDKAPQVVTFTSPAPTHAIAGGPTYTPTATGGASGNPVVISVDGSSSSVCALNGTVVSFIGPGTCTLDGNQAGDASYSAAIQVQQSFTVVAASPPAITTTLPPGLTIGDVPTAFTASIANTGANAIDHPGATIEFSIVGPSGLVPADLTVSYESAPNVYTPIPLTGTGTLTGTFGPVGGIDVPVGYDSTTNLEVTVNGGAPSGHYGVGIDLLDAHSSIIGSASSDVIVRPDATGTVTTLTAGSSPSVTGQSVTFTASVSPTSAVFTYPTGTVAFTSDGTTIAGCGAVTLVREVATCTTTFDAGAGASHSIVATFSSGDGNFAGSTAPALTQNVKRAGTSMTVTSSANPTPAFQNVTYTATVSETPRGMGATAGTVAFKDGASTIAGCASRPLSGGVATCTTSYRGGPRTTHAITATYSGDPSFTGSTSPVLDVVVDSSIGEGYWLATANAGIFAFGGASFYGSGGSLQLNSPVVDTVATPDGKGYWLVAADGGIFAYGDAAFYGSAGSLHLNKPIVGMAATPDGKGYWLVAADGGIFAYGDAAFYGSAGSRVLNQPVVGMASTHDGRGYWLVAADGGIFAYGDAAFYGSAGNLNLFRPVVGMVATPSGQGYWLVAADGGIFAYGDAYFVGSTGGVPQNSPAVGLATP